MNGLIEKRAVNFGPGPAKLPEAVLKQAQRELYCFQTTGLSVLEMSHRSVHYAEMNKAAESELRGLLSIPNNYKVLFLQGGGTGQFAAVPFNLMGGEKPVADYIVTGNWSNKAAIEAAKYLTVNYVIPKPAKFNKIPDQNEWNLTPEASYVYYCANETAHGIEFPFIPDTGEVPLVCDMSSNILTKEVDVSKFGVIIAGAQKNIGSAGVTVVIVREDLIDKAHPMCPAILDYKVNSDASSVYNTPPVYSVYIMKLVFEWISQQGGAPAMALNSRAKSGLVYATMDEFDDVFFAAVEKPHRSRVNATFRIGCPEGNTELEQKFISEAGLRNLISLKGHRSVGGIRVSMYNAMSVEEVQRLVKFMKEFALQLRQQKK